MELKFVFDLAVTFLECVALFFSVCVLQYGYHCLGMSQSIYSQLKDEQTNNT